MAVPILLVTGFLGAGKTTLVNRLLAAADRRIAAVVNDFGAVNIDAELIEGATDGVVSLPGGCICCTLEGELLRTLRRLLQRDPAPEAIVIETSGVADPAEIVRTLLDPVIARAALLETVICVADATAEPAALADPLLRSQLRAADLVVLSKTDLAAEPAALRAAIAAIKPAATILLAPEVDAAIAFGADPDAPPRQHAPGRARPAADRFAATQWTSDHPISLPRLRAAIEALSPRLVRAKGVFEAVERPGRPFLLQLASGRATLTPGPATRPDLPCVRMVFIAEIGRVDAKEITASMERCQPP